MEREEDKDITINGCRRKISSTQHSSQFDFIEPDLKIRVGKKLGYVKNCIHVKHIIPLDLISMNWTLKHVSVKGQLVVRTCQSGSLKYHKYQDIESEVEEEMNKWLAKNSSQRL